MLFCVWLHIFSQPHAFALECFNETLKVTLRQEVPVFPKFPVFALPFFLNLSLAFLLGKTLLQFRAEFHHTAAAAAAAAKSLQLCPTLCKPIAGSPPGSAVPGIRKGNS